MAKYLLEPQLPVDPNNAWSGDANAFDGNTATIASTTTSGSISANYLYGQGTTAPTTGNSITQVRARMYGIAPDGVSGNAGAIYTDGLAELLGTVNGALAATNGYTAYTTLSTPTGGWTWAKVSELEVKLFSGSTFNQTSIAKVEIEVTDSSSTVASYYFDGLGNANDAFLLENGTDYYLQEDNTAPTIAPDTADLTAFSTTTPTLEFTGTDDSTNSNDVQYEIQIDTASTFDSQSSFATPNVVQTVKINNVASTPGTASLTGVTAGNTIIISTVAANSTAGMVTGITDSSGNTYTKRFEKSDAVNGLQLSQWYCRNVSAGTHNFQVAFNDTLTNASALIKEYSGILSTADPSDGQTVLSSTATSNAPTTPTYTANSTNELLITTVAVANNTPVFTVGSGWGHLDQQNSGGSWSIGYEDRVAANSTGYNGSLSLVSSAGWLTAIAGYKAAGSVSPLLDKLSSTDAGFVNTIGGSDTQPFNSGDKVSYTVQSALIPGTYYWRVRAIDPTGSNTYSSWAATRSFTVTSGGTTGDIKVWNGSAFSAKPVKVWNGSAWVQKPLKQWNGSAWVATNY